MQTEHTQWTVTNHISKNSSLLSIVEVRETSTSKWLKGGTKEKTYTNTGY